MSALPAVLAHPWVGAVVRIAGLALLAGATTTLATFVYRVRVRQTLPEGATLILGLGVVAIYLNTRLVFVQFVGETANPLSVEEAVVNVIVFVVAGVASYVGRSVGDRLGRMNRFSWGMLQPNFNPIVRATGRFTTVTLPTEIEDIEGYDAVDGDTKKALSGRVFDFPRGMSVGDLETELAARLTEKHDIGYVDLEVTAEGTIDYLGVGQETTGIGPTLPPGSAATAIRADPPFSATAGDSIQVWHHGEDGERRLGLAELRASVGPIATISTDEETAHAIDPTEEYRLMTVPADSHPDREFAAMLRRSDETMRLVEIGADSPLVGSVLGALDVTVIAVRSPDGEVTTTPDREHVVQAGDVLFAIGRPDALRTLDGSTGAASGVGDVDLETAAAEAIDWEESDR